LTCVSGASARLIPRANLRLSVASSAGSIIVLRSLLALRASFRDHPSGSSFRLSDNPFVRFCFPITLQLAPLPNRLASPSAPSPACTADLASNSAVLSVRAVCAARKNLPASSSAASSACTVERASDSAVLPDARLAPPIKLSGLIFDSYRQLAPSVDLRFLRCDRSPACAFARSFRLTFRDVHQLAP